MAAADATYPPQPMPPPANNNEPPVESPQAQLRTPAPTAQEIAQEVVNLLPAPIAPPVQQASLSEPSAPADNGSAEKPAYVFHKEVGGWSIRFNGGPSWILADNLIGLKCLAFLIRNQGKTYTHKEVFRETRDGAQDGGRSEQEAMDEGLSLSGELPPKAFDMAGKTATEEFIRDQEGLAEATTDPEKKAEHLEQVERARKYLSKGLNRWGRSRKLGDPVENVRKKVSQAIDRAVEAIENGDKLFAQHLRNEMQKTTYRSYSPSPSIPWTIIS
jgi:hypothetical protein